MEFICKFEMHPITQLGCIVSIYGTQATPNKMYHQKIGEHSKQHSYHPRQNRPDQQTVLSSPSSHNCLLLKLERVP